MATGTNHRPWAIAAAVLGSAMLALYLAVVLSEGDNSFGDIAPWASLMGAGALAAIAATLIRDDQVAKKAMVGAAVLWGLIGVLSILSIGIGFLAAAAFAAIGAGYGGPTRS